jgi:hypothetical protein
MWAQFADRGRATAATLSRSLARAIAPLRPGMRLSSQPAPSILADTEEARSTEGEHTFADLAGADLAGGRKATTSRTQMDSRPGARSTSAGIGTSVTSKHPVAKPDFTTDDRFRHRAASDPVQAHRASSLRRTPDINKCSGAYRIACCRLASSFARKSCVLSHF